MVEELVIGQLVEEEPDHPWFPRMPAPSDRMRKGGLLGWSVIKRCDHKSWQDDEDCGDAGRREKRLR